MKTLILNEDNKVLRVQLNRPQVKNAMNEEMIAELTEVFSSIDSEIRALCLSGSAGFFCAGGDLNWMKSSLDKTKEENEADAKALGKMLRSLDECPVPVITTVEGGAFGGGVGLVAASDIVLADEGALFSLSEVRLGLIPATIGPIVMRKVGMSQARRLYLTGFRFAAKEAKLIQLVHHVGSVKECQEKEREYLKALSMSGPKAVRRAKTFIREIMGPDLWKADISETTSQVLSEVRVGPEAQEGITAFLEKRKANWIQELA